MQNLQQGQCRLRPDERLVWQKQRIVEYTQMDFGTKHRINLLPIVSMRVAEDDRKATRPGFGGIVGRTEGCEAA
ncbi:MAG TPA: hypothetical protein VFM25_04730 [Verrucomicrobiae bacterium]|nr:hypothetical protein [Verrucomicrobiae bacterium]